MDEVSNARAREAVTAPPTGTGRTDPTGRPTAARKEDGGPVAAILLVVLLALLGWAASVAIWGLPGLYIPALAMVPVIWVVLILISRG